MPKYLNTKPGSLESAVLEAVSPAQQAAIAIAKKEKGEKPKNEEKVECPKCKGEGCDHCDGKGYHMVDEGSKEEYEKFFKSALKKFGVDSPADFKSDEEKKKFFDYVDKNYKGENEETDLEEAGSQGMFLVIQGENDNKQKVVSMHKKKADATKARDAWNDKNKPAKRTHNARVYAVGPFATTDGKPKTFKVGDNVMYSDFAKNIVKEEVSLAQLAAQHITDMWVEASGSKTKTEKIHDDENKNKKETKTTMTGKPMSGVEINPKSKED